VRFFKRAPKPAIAASGTDALQAMVRSSLRDADEDTERVVIAVAGLLASVAYADRVYGAAERGYARAALARLDGLTDEGVDAICEVLEQRGQEIAAQNPQAFTRELRERVEVPLRREVLDVLVDLAAVDGELSLAETDLLRRTAAALGLTPDDYLASQQRHRDKLSLLR
jgi:uncharacterized tellurite resistance protein B-like protein